MTKRVVLYIREALDGQSLAQQLLTLTEIAHTRNWTVVKTYVDHTISYAKDKKSGEAFREMCDASESFEFDLVMAYSIDRLGRSLQELAAFLSGFHEKNIDFYLHKQGINTTLPEKKSLFFMCDVLAEFERLILRERVNAGIKRARSNGVKLGRPRAPLATEQKILNYRSQGMAIKTIAKTLNIGVSVVQRVLKVDSHD